jgi:hypothetical protein
MDASFKVGRKTSPSARVRCGLEMKMVRKHGAKFSLHRNNICGSIKTCDLNVYNTNHEFYIIIKFFSSSSLLPHVGACSRFWSIGLIFNQYLNQGRSVGLLGRVISSSQGIYLYTNTEKHIHIHKH